MCVLFVVTFVALLYDALNVLIEFQLNFLEMGPPTKPKFNQTF